MHEKHLEIPSIEKYSTIIFDFDGVILDSNNIKKIAILNAASGILDDEITKEFVDYFVRLNGVPREDKIAKYYSGKDYIRVLENYESIIKKELNNAKLIPGVKEILNSFLEKGKDMLILSGGSEGEVRELAKKKGIYGFFSGIYGGPKNKQENLSMLSIKKPVLYFGDSEVDYVVSKNNGFDFIFVYGASNIENWRAKVNDWKVVKSIRDFRNES